MSAIKAQAPAGTVDLPEFTDPPGDPIDLFRGWLDEARAKEVREPGALSLGTADSGGRASVRIVMLLNVTANGLVFSSHAGSHKGREIAETSWASALAYWRETRQQISLSGHIEQLSDAESDALWASRPPVTYPMSVASEQSARLDDEGALRAEAERLAESGEELARPELWCGYHLVPSIVEFWQESPDRLHRRLRYDRTDAGWTAERLQP
jgi:pyridoxamine-phosphate oxidase